MNCLTLREQEVLKWVANGKSAWEIAKILDVTERTVNFHATNAKTKFKATTRSQAALEAFKRGLIEV